MNDYEEELLMDKIEEKKRNPMSLLNLNRKISKMEMDELFAGES